MKEGAMPGDNERRGLCVNCDNAQHCTYPRGPDHPVTLCEEFACGGSGSQMTADNNVLRPEASKAGGVVFLEEECVTPSDNGRHGLCLNCKNAPECTHPRSSDRPISQCEEFDYGGLAL